MAASTPEHFVDAVVAAEFLQLTPRYVQNLAKAGELPAYPLGRGARRIWRFRLSDLATAMEARRGMALVAEKRETSYRSKPTKRSGRGR